jgi:hypothetical protein
MIDGHRQSEQDRKEHDGRPGVDGTALADAERRRAPTPQEDGHDDAERCAGPAELLHAIRVVAAGDALLAPRTTRRLIAQFAVGRRAVQAAKIDWRC